MEILKRNKKKIIGAFLLIILVVFLLNYENRSKVSNPAGFEKLSGEEVSVSKEEYSQNPLTIEESEDVANTISGDLGFAQETAAFYERNPWYKNIPIDKDNYSITYNFEKASFRIRLKMIEGSLSEEAESELIQQALVDIQNIGANPESYYILYMRE